MRSWSSRCIPARRRLHGVPERGWAFTSIATDGRQANTPSSAPAVSADAASSRRLHCLEFVPGDTNGQQDVFAHDLAVGETSRIGLRDGSVVGFDLDTGTSRHAFVRNRVHARAWDAGSKFALVSSGAARGLDARATPWR